jgi:hypothetical protein
MGILIAGIIIAILGVIVAAIPAEARGYVILAAIAGIRIWYATLPKTNTEPQPASVTYVIPTPTGLPPAMPVPVTPHVPRHWPPRAPNWSNYRRMANYPTENIGSADMTYE